MSVVSTADVLKYVNQARTDPKSFAEYVQKDLNKFLPDGWNIPLAPNFNYRTNEGKGAW